MEWGPFWPVARSLTELRAACSNFLYVFQKTLAIHVVLHGPSPVGEYALHPRVEAYV
jgi:hypothetical protein